MRLFLNDFIQTLSTRREEKVSTVLEDAKVGKEQLNTIAQKLVSFQNFAPLLITKENTGEKISGNRLALNFRDLDLQMAELYRTDNLVSDLLNGNMAILSATIKGLEDEVIALNKLVDNYAFLLADGGSFNYAFLEPFNDERGRDSFPFSIPDRASQFFGPLENAEVRSDEGVLALSENILVPNSIAGSIVNSNATACVVTDNGISNALANTPARGWRYIVAAPTPVTSSLPEANGRTGAQINVEFLMTTPGPASELKIVPFAEHPVEVLSIQLYENVNSADFRQVLDVAQSIDRPFTVHFPVQTVAKFRVVFNQPIYERVVDAVNTGEDAYRKVWEQYQAQRSCDPRFTYLERLFKNKQAFDRLYAFVRVINFVRSVTDDAIISLPQGPFDPINGPLRVDWVQTQFDLHEGLLNWDPPNPAVEQITNYIADDTNGMVTILPYPMPGDSINPLLGGVPSKLFSRHRRSSMPLNLFRDILPWRSRTQTTGDMSSLTNPPNLFTTLMNQSQNPTASFNYTYFLGIQYVGIGLSAPGFKGVFVSKSYDSDGDIGEVRMKTSEVNVRLGGNRNDDNILTSVEYSVSNVSSPSRESDWVPILPIGQNTIDSERFFPDATGQGLFRFPAIRDSSIEAFRNGTSMSLSATDFIYDASRLLVLGLNLPLGETSGTDIFTVKYVPSQDFSTVNFADSGFINVPLISAYDNDGAGEGFTGSGGRNTIDLVHSPYIDENLIQANAASKVSVYQPITIVFETGDIGQNMTNYWDGPQVSLPAPPTAVPAYLHSGRTIIFNDVINQPFRVYYQYLQNNVRTRVVLRVNEKNFASPKVDFVHLKAKTRRANRVGTMS